MKKENDMNYFIRSLEERAKELHCLYKVDEVLNTNKENPDAIFEKLVKVIPTGFQYISYCESRIVIEDKVYSHEGFKETPWVISADLKIHDLVAGRIDVYYLIELPKSDEGSFTVDERKLINTIADRISHYLLYNKLNDIYSELNSQRENEDNNKKPEWNVILNLIKHTDQNLFSIISRKMIVLLFCRGIQEAAEIFAKIGNLDSDEIKTEINKPSKKQILEQSFNLSNETFEIAKKYLSEQDILNNIQKWINEEKSSFLVRTLANPHTPINEIYDAIRRYLIVNPLSNSDDSPLNKGIRVSLIRRFLSDQLEYINIAKDLCTLQDFDDLLKNLIFPPDGHGKLGGKTAGLFLAKKIIESSEENKELFNNIKMPKTWYITSDAIMHFMYYNNLEDVIEQKYKDINDIRHEYSYVIQAFKNASFPAELINGLSRALDDFGDSPIIVRSSSLLEDRLGAIFAGKYKSLFLANQGTKQERLESLCDAIAEVYASVFGPDPIGYRIERGLLDFNEEMGIMIQEVVGTHAGNYFFPAYAGVAFSFNEFRWSPRIEREDGLIRLVPGLGTRAVDRIGDDYPILISPGKPALRLNLSFEQIVGYAPKYIDLINIRTNSFESLKIDDLLKEIGDKFPAINKIFSIREQHHLKAPIGLGIDTKRDDVIVTFDNLINDGKMLKQISKMLNIIRDSMKAPIDLEFASDGDNLFILQCRPQSSNSISSPDVIPKNISKENILFTANKFVSNGKVPDIQYIVYVDPLEYSNVQSLEDLKSIGRVIGRLNQILPKKSFILMGPGRWGSRGDIRLGVSVTYTDIFNTSMLIEIARAKGNYVPDLSFGTHFFQDLVEANIKYLPLYPDESGILFNDDFFINSANKLEQFFPEFAYLSKVIKLINVPEIADGKKARMLMNADESSALCYLTNTTHKIALNSTNSEVEARSTEPWEIRWEYAEHIASNLNSQKFGVINMYLFGTVYNKSAGSKSDIDLLVHYDGNEFNKEKLMIWFEGWEHSLKQQIFANTGYIVEKLLDITYISDNDQVKNEYFHSLISNNNTKCYKLKLNRG